MQTYKFSTTLTEHIRSKLLEFGSTRNPPLKTLKQAAVAIVLAAADDGSGETTFFLTLRSATLRSHAGQYALPGGRIEKGEVAVETAIRECHEEIALTLTADQILGTLDIYVTQSGYTITPVVFATTKKLNPRPAPNEVEQIFQIKLSELTGTRAAQLYDEESESAIVRFPIFDHYIHAPTAAILYQFMEMMHGRYTRVDNLKAPKFATR